MFIDGGPDTPKERIREVLPRLEAIEPPLSRILLGRKRIIPRTTSGKKRYIEYRELLASGRVTTVLDVNLSEAR